MEICRDIANRFNGVYGETFRIPEPFIPKVGARVMSLTSPGNKMSKSDKDPNGCVYVLEKPEDIMRKFKKAVTDSDTERCVRYDRAEKPGVANLMTIYSAATGKTYEAIEREFDGKGYGDVQARRGRVRGGAAAPHPGGDGSAAGRQGVSGERVPRWCGEGCLCRQPHAVQGL